VITLRCVGMPDGWVVSYIDSGPVKSELVRLIACKTEFNPTWLSKFLLAAFNYERVVVLEVYHLDLLVARIPLQIMPANANEWS
jgi:hypothetical protein